MTYHLVTILIITMYNYSFIVDQGTIVGRKKAIIPSLLCHKPTGLGYSVIDGKYVYHGVFGTHDCVVNYKRAIASTTQNGVTVITIGSAIVQYTIHCQKNYPPRSNEPTAIMRALKLLDHNATTFSSSQLLTLRQSWIDDRASISTINKRHAYIVNFFRWAAMIELLPASIWQSLQTVPKLRPGRSAAPLPKVVGPVTDQQIDAVRPYVSDTVWMMIQVQKLTGMRTGELLAMTDDQIVDNVYRPRSHKNQWRNQHRLIYLGPKVREILRLPIVGYTASSYARAIARACKQAGIDHWHPHQLRHYHATIVRKQFGLEAAQAVLGHASAKTTEIYAEVSNELALRVSKNF